MKQCMTVEFVRVNSLPINGCQFGSHPFSKSIISYLQQRTQLVVPPTSGKNHYQFATQRMGSQGLSSLFQYLFMLTNHMSEDDETHF